MVIVEQGLSQFLLELVSTSSSVSTDKIKQKDETFNSPCII